MSHAPGSWGDETQWRELKGESTFGVDPVSIDVEVGIAVESVFDRAVLDFFDLDDRTTTSASAEGSRVGGGREIEGRELDSC